MKKISIKKVTNNEIDWVNSKYTEVGFVKSNFAKEFILTAEVENQKAGLGRLVRIDDHHIELGGIYTFPAFRGLGIAEQIVSALCEQSPFPSATTWCLPFEKLLNFYLKFGFKKHQDGAVPKEVQEKLNWCNSNHQYEQKVILLYKEDGIKIH